MVGREQSQGHSHEQSHEQSQALRYVQHSGATVADSLAKAELVRPQSLVVNSEMRAARTIRTRPVLSSLSLKLALSFCYLAVWCYESP